MTDLKADLSLAMLAHVQNVILDDMGSSSMTERLFKMTVYFTSGLSTYFIMYEEEFEKVKESLRDSWEASIVSELYGFQWQHVTHYDVEIDDDGEK
jgi:hypothetical protein